MSLNTQKSTTENNDLKTSIPAQYKDLNPFQLQINFIESESLFLREKQNREVVVSDFIQSQRQKLNQNLQQIVNELWEFKQDFNSNKDKIDSEFKIFFNWKTNILPNSTNLERFYLENPDFINEFKLNPNFSWLIKDLYEITYYRFALKFLNEKKQKELVETDKEKIENLTRDILLQNSDYSEI